MIIYLAGPIDDVSTEDATNWRQFAARYLAFHGMGAYDPAAAFSPCPDGFGVTIDDAPAVRAINNTAIQLCDAVLANCFTGFTLGTVREIERAKKEGLPVFLVEPDGGTNSFEKHDLVCSSSLNVALALIKRAAPMW